MTSPFNFIPHRVVSLVPSLTESVFHLGLGNRLVAITDYCTKPEAEVKRLPRLGGTKNPDLQRIIELQPDLVLMNAEENRLEDQQALEAAGIVTWVTEPRTVLQAFNVLWDMMDIFEDASRSEMVRQIERAYDYTEGAMGAQRLVRVFVPIWYDPWMTINQDTFVHDMLLVCGGQNVFAARERQFPLAADIGDAEPLPDDDPRVEGHDRRYPRISLEEIIAQQPELILLPDEPYPFSEEHIAIFASLDIPAAKRGHIYPIDGSLLTWHGTRIAFALQELPPIFDRVRRDLETLDTE